MRGNTKPSQQRTSTRSQSQGSLNDYTDKQGQAAGTESHDRSHTPDKEKTEPTLTTVMERLDLILSQLTEMKASHEGLESKVSTLEKEVKENVPKIQGIEDSMESVHTSIDSIRAEVKSMGSNFKIEMTALKDTIDDMSNRLRRNNMIVYNIPEKSTKNPTDCAEFMESFIKDFLDIDAEIVVERAHRTLRAPSEDPNKPRPIICKFLNWRHRQNVLKNGIKVLKSKTYEGKKIYLSDDVTQRVRNDRKQLIPKMLELRSQGFLAFIPFSIPAIILWKDKNTGYLKKITLSDIKK